jgi:hypothetical protein
MSDTNARHGPSPTPSLNSVKLGKHQPQPTATVSTADPSLPPVQPTGGFDLTTVLLLAVFAAIVVRIFWKALLGLAVVAVLAVVFAGILIPMAMVTQNH